MQVVFRKSVLLSLAVAAVVGVLCGSASAQNISPLHEFTQVVPPDFSNADGAQPYGALALAGNTLYGTTGYGGTSANGTIFKVNTDGSGFNTLYHFSGPAGSSPVTNHDGACPLAGLLLSGNTLYGTASSGGSSGAGTIFAINTNGAGFTNLHNFTDSPTDGSAPYAGLIQSGNTLYGTTSQGGNAGAGTVFAINTDGTGYTILHHFLGGSDGAAPVGGLVLSGRTLYGTTEGDNLQTYGTVFAVNTDGSGFTNLHHFSAVAYPSYANGDGAQPQAGLILSGNTLYGTTFQGGRVGFGTIFAVKTDGTGFTTLYNFANGTDGAWPQAGLLMVSNTLYGTAFTGSIPDDDGTVFSIHADGTGFLTLGSFAEYGGSGPSAGLLMVSNTLYGTAAWGGSADSGTLYQLAIPATVHPGFFNGEVGLNDGVYYLYLTNGYDFGYYTYAYFPYLYHFDLGFEYYMEANDGHNDVYLYDFTSGHFWYTGPTLFPFIYDIALQAWLYYYPDTQRPGRYTTNPRKFYNFATSQVIQE